MSKIAFYHLNKWPLEKALPKLLEKVIKTKKRAIVISATPERVAALDELLWSYEKDAWLAHGSMRDGDGEEQPIWLTSKDENPNMATFLFLTDGATSEHVGEYERCFELFDGNDDEATQAARQRWKAYDGAGHKVTYWCQTDNGGWQEGKN